MVRRGVGCRRRAERAAVHKDAMGIDLRAGREGGVRGVGGAVHARLRSPPGTAAVAGIVHDQERRVRRLKVTHDRPDRRDVFAVAVEPEKRGGRLCRLWRMVEDGGGATDLRSEEHTSELQSQSNLVCRLLLEKKKNVNM